MDIREELIQEIMNIGFVQECGLIDYLDRNDAIRVVDHLLKYYRIIEIE